MAGTCFATQSALAAGMGGPMNSGVGGFQIIAPPKYLPGESFTVQIVGHSQFKGFLLYAKDTSGNRVGAFAPNGMSRSNLLKCTNSSTISHSNSILKGLSFLFVQTKISLLVYVGPTVDFVFSYSGNTSISFEAAVVVSMRDWYILTPVSVQLTASTTIVDVNSGAISSGSSAESIKSAAEAAELKRLQSLTTLELQYLCELFHLSS